MSAATSGKPAVLWVHGYTLAGSVFAPVWQGLPHLEHVAPDLPGHGACLEPVAAGTAFDQAVETMRAAVEHSRARRLVAMSYGGAVALALLETWPDLIDQAVLFAPALPGGPIDEDAADAHLSLLAASQRGAQPDSLAQQWLDAETEIFAGLRQHPDRFAMVEQLVKQHQFSELRVGGMPLPAGEQLKLRLNRITASVTVVVGENDMPAFKRGSELIVKAIARAQRIWLPDAGHQPLLEIPEQSAELLLKIWNDLSVVRTFGTDRGVN